MLTFATSRSYYCFGGKIRKCY